MRRRLRPSRSGLGVHSEQSKALCPLSPASQLAHPMPTGRLRLGLAAWERAHSPPTCAHSTQTSRRQGLSQGPPQASCTRVTRTFLGPAQTHWCDPGGCGGCSSLCPARSTGDAPARWRALPVTVAALRARALLACVCHPLFPQRVPRAQHGVGAPPAPSAAAG